MLSSKNAHGITLAAALKGKRYTFMLGNAAKRAI